MDSADILAPANCRAPGASGVYDGLLEFVMTKYGDRPPASQAIIFSLAYTYYSRRKKQSINDQCIFPARTLEEKANNDRVIHGIIREHCNQGSYDVTCHSIALILDDLQKQFISETVTKFGEGVQANLQPLANSLAQVSTSVNQLLHPPPPVPMLPPSNGRKFLGFLAEGAHHLGLLALVSLYALLIAWTIKIGSPTAMRILHQLVEDPFQQAPVQP